MTPERILLIRSGGLGDAILTLPVAHRLRNLHPDAELHVLGNGTMLAAARLTALFTGSHSLDGAGFSALFAESGPTDFLRAFFAPFDRVYCFTAGNGPRLARTILASGARACATLDPRPPDGLNTHITGHLLSILGPETPPAELPRPVHPAPHARDSRLLVIHPGSGGIPKTWPLERFLAVAEHWPGETILLLGPAERERGYRERIAGNLRTLDNPPLSKAAEILSGAGVSLGNDSGVSHLAALAGAPSVVLFGPGDPRVWRPIGDRVTVIASPDGAMEGIATADVIRAVMETARRETSSGAGGGIFPLDLTPDCAIFDMRAPGTHFRPPGDTTTTP